MDKEGYFYTPHKTIMRRMGFNIGLTIDNVIINETTLKPKRKLQYQKFIEEYDFYLYDLIGRKVGFNCYNDPNDKDAITPQEI